ncbi:MAG TPA: hypothetical protein VMF07_10525 [Solirubrobacteraceae bacterium]|nr:hypothetical protein [Solirubrobacteraceae bacterium]
MNVTTAVAIVLAIAWTTLTNIAYQRQHDAAAALPSLSMRRPIESLRRLIGDRTWILGFALETGGFAFYASAVGLGSLALVQTIGAGGIGVLAWVSARVSGRRLSRRHLIAVNISVLGLLALGISLTHAAGPGGKGRTGAILAWMAACALVAVIVLAIGRVRGAVAVSEGIAGGLFSSIGDLSTKLATQGGVRLAFVVTVAVGYVVGTGLLQLGYQRGETLTVAGIGTLFTNAVPIVAGTVLLAEPVPGGVFGVLRVGAFCAVVAGAIMLASSEPAPESENPPAAAEAA